MGGWHLDGIGMPTRVDRRAFLKQLTMLPAISLAAQSSPHLAPAAQDRPSNVIIVVFDALSATNMSLYGYPRETTPNIERFASRSTVFNRHYAGGNFTSPGAGSLLTGAYPWSHRCMHLYGTVARPFAENNLFHLFSGSAYQRAAYSHNDHAAMLLYQFSGGLDLFKKTKELALFYEKPLSDSAFMADHNTAIVGERALIRGQSEEIPASLLLSVLHRIWRTKVGGDLWDKYKRLFPRGVPTTNANPLYFLLEDAIDWLEALVSDLRRPMLGYFHFFPPHEPYNTRKDFVHIFQKDGFHPPEKPDHTFSQGIQYDELKFKRRMYDEYIAYADAEFGRLVDFMGQRGLLENTYLILTSDHGEMFERGILEHVTPTLFEPIIHIPLIIHKPGQQSREDVHLPTSCVDLVPTIAHLAGREAPGWSEGQVLPTLGDSPQTHERAVFSVEAKQNNKRAPLRKATIAMVKGDHKLVGYFGYGKDDPQYELYDIVSDPEELYDLYSESSMLASDLRVEMLAKLDEVNRPFM